jgi:hypothetical protein
MTLSAAQFQESMSKLGIASARLVIVIAGYERGSFYGAHCHTTGAKDPQPRPLGSGIREMWL